MRVGKISGGWEELVMIAKMGREVVEVCQKVSWILRTVIINNASS